MILKVYLSVDRENQKQLLKIN